MLELPGGERPHEPTFVSNLALRAANDSNNAASVARTSEAAEAAAAPSKLPTAVDRLRAVGLRARFEAAARPIRATERRTMRAGRAQRPPRCSVQDSTATPLSNDG
eukprot:6211949-Pleurochrysis_carterae.AAC.3